jgi:hypothetical protein
MSDIFTDRHDAFQALMAGTGGVASAEPSSLPTNQMEDDHKDGMTHSCGGCSGWSPCGSCGGNIPKDHPAYQALAWNLSVVDRDDAATTKLWSIANVANNLRQASLPDDEITGAVLQVVSNAVLFQTGLGVPAYFDWIDDYKKRIAKAVRMAKNRARIHGAEDPPVGSGDHVCCPDSISIPLELTETISRQPGGRWLMKYNFWEKAKWKPGGSEPDADGLMSPCDCQCCEVRQFWAYEDSTGAKIENQEDCVYIDPSTPNPNNPPPNDTRPIGAWPKGTPPPAGWPIGCFGVRHPKGDLRSLFSDYYECEYEGEDTSSYVTPASGHFEFKSTWTLEILDACDDYITKMKKEFELTFTGEIEASGPTGTTLGKITPTKGGKAGYPRFVYPR